jgi:hypothetical protein
MRCNPREPIPQAALLRSRRYRTSNMEFQRAWRPLARQAVCKDRRYQRARRFLIASECHGRAKGAIDSKGA